MTKIKTLAEEEMDSHKHWTKNLFYLVRLQASDNDA